MKLIECLKLQYRATSYKNRKDKGGIFYLRSAIENGQTVFDIGAHKAGYLYYMLKQVGRNGKVFVFEPQSILYQYIIKLKTLFLWENVTIEHLALSDSKGRATLYIPKRRSKQVSSPGATIVEQTERSDIAFTEMVSTETLDSYCNQNNIEPDFLKIDVEGNELRILRGGLDILKRCRPKIYVEIEARHVGQEQVLETFRFMESLGYTGHFIHGLNPVPLRDFSFDKFQSKNDMKNYCNNFTFE
jgi:FkbM family methyltransferase